MTGSTWRDRLHSVAVVAMVLVLATSTLGPVAAVSAGSSTNATAPTTTAVTTITSCTTITSAGVYELGSDVSAGDYDCINVSASDVVFDGQGHTVDGTSGHNGINVTGSSPISNVTVRNVKVTGAGTGIQIADVSDVHVENVHVFENVDGLSMFDVTEGYVNDSNVSNHDSGSGIDLYSGTSDVTVDGTTVTDNFDHGIQVRAQQVTINDSLIEDNGDLSDTRTGEGILLDDASNVTITNNRIRNNSYAIDEEADTPDVLVRNNDVTVQRSGLNFIGGDNWTVVGNNFTPATAVDDPYGVYTSSGDATFEHNEFRDLSQGIYTYSTNGGSSEFEVVDNYFEGITQNEGVTSNKNDDTIADNRFVETNPAIQLQEGNRTTIRNNTIRGASTAITGSPTTSSNGIYDVRIVGNDVSVSNDGIRLTNVNGTFARNNTIRATDPIEVSQGADNHFVDNVVRTKDTFDKTVFVANENATNTTVEDLDIGASTAANTTLSFTAKNVELANETSPPGDPAGEENVGRYVDATSTAPDSYLDVTFDYDESAVFGNDESKLDVWRYDGSWQELGGSQNLADETIRYNVTSFGTIAVLVNSSLLDSFWSNSTAGRSQYSTPAIGSDRVFVGGLDDTLYAFFRANGSTDWSFDRQGSLADSSPAYDSGTVYVGSGAAVLYALDAATGSVQWARQTDSAIVSSPAVAGDTVYVGSNDGTVIARNASDGSLRWTVEVGAPVYSSPAVAGGTVYVTADDGSVVAIDASSGTEQWTSDAGRDLGHASPVAASGTVYVAGDRVYALYAGNGSTKWSRTWGGTAGSTPAIESGWLYVGSADGSVYRLKASDGTVDWTTATGGPVGSSPAVVADRVVVGSDNGTVHVIDASTGSEVGFEAVGSPVRSSPAVGNDVAYVGSRSGEVYALANLNVTPT